MSVAEDIRTALQERGGQTLDELANSTGQKKKSLSSRLYDLKRWGQVTQDHNSAYWLTGQDQEDAPETSNGATPGPGPSTSTAIPTQERHVPLSADEEEFQKLLVDCDVRRARDTITRTFFNGDVYDLQNLVEILEDAKGYVNPNQARMILRYWARYIGGDLSKLAKLEERLSRSVPALNGSGGSEEGKFIEELGWTVDKDKDGDWVPKLGGELSHREALRWAATMNATRSRRDDDDDDDEDDPKDRRRKRRDESGKDPEVAFLDRMTKYKELFAPDTSSKDEEVRLLKDRLEQIEKERADERLERLEGMVAAALTKNPLTEFIQMRNQLNELSPPSSPVTDNSPAVQLIKDQSDKVTKGMDRLTGILERAALRGHDRIVAEEEYSPEEREAKAGALVKKLEQGNESKQLREELFGR